MNRIKRNYIVNFHSATADLEDFAELDKVLIENLAAAATEGSNKVIAIAT